MDTSPAIRTATAVSTNDVTVTTTSLAKNAGSLRGTATNVERAMPVVNSELISSTPRDPRINWAKAIPDVGTPDVRAAPCSANAAAASGSDAATSANVPVDHADRAAKPTTTTTVQASRITVDSRVRNLMNSEFNTRAKMGPGTALPPCSDLPPCAAERVVVVVLIVSFLRPGRESKLPW